MKAFQIRYPNENGLNKTIGVYVETNKTIQQVMQDMSNDYKEHIVIERVDKWETKSYKVYFILNRESYGETIVKAKCPAQARQLVDTRLPYGSYETMKVEELI